LGKGQLYQCGLLRDTGVLLRLPDQFFVECDCGAHLDLTGIDFSIVLMMISVPERELRLFDSKAKRCINQCVLNHVQALREANFGRYARPIQLTPDTEAPTVLQVEQKRGVPFDAFLGFAVRPFPLAAVDFNRRNRRRTKKIDCAWTNDRTI
jgi:hypothetical protein